MVLWSLQYSTTSLIDRESSSVNFPEKVAIIPQELTFLYLVLIAKGIHEKWTR